MGFKMKAFMVQEGTVEFPSGTTDAIRRQRSEVLLSKSAQCLLDCNCGWQLDTSRNATVTSFVDIPSIGTTPKQMPGLFFINTISGCKLFLSYFGTNIYSYGINNFGSTSNFRFNPTYRHGGLCASIIPEGSNSVFGDPTTSTFIPDDATRICGTAYGSSSSTTYSNAGYNPTSGYYYKFYIWATPTVFMIYITHHDTSDLGFWVTPIPIYACGKIFGSVANQSDNSIISKYGTIIFREESGSSGEAWATVIESSVANLVTNGGSFKVPGYTGSFGSKVCSICFSDSSGAWINGKVSSSAPYHNQTYFPAAFYALGVSSFSSSTDVLWSPIAVYMATSDISVHYIAPGCAFKGYLDTDLFRAAAFTSMPVSTRFDNGNFYYAKDTNSALILGWDPSNTVSGM